MINLSRANTASRQIGLRANIILLAFGKLNNSQIAEQLDVGRHCVGLWRRRWQNSFDALLSIEFNESHTALRRAVQDTLSDAPRSGRPRTFSDEQVAQIVSMATRSPRDYDRPVDDWTGRELANEAKRQKIVETISTSRVNRFLGLVDLKPQHRKGWCFTTEKDKELFDEQVKEVCRIYLEASQAWCQFGTHTVCVDEMTSLQANERRAPTMLPLPGQVGKTECQYTRHGTLSLTGSWEVAAGQMIRTTIDKTRTGEDFASHIMATISSDPDGEWIFVMDNLNTHYGEPIVRAIARQLGIDESTLGDKKKRKGVLGSVASRKAFLSDPSHRIRIVFIPKHSSWLNQIEMIFGVISRRVMRNGDFASLQDLEDKLQRFVDYFNRTFAKPVNWKYDGSGKRFRQHTRPKTWREKRQVTRSEQILALVA
ncbi:MAG: transposase [Pirellulaceae bacterium]